MATKLCKSILIPQNKATWPNCIWLGRISKQLYLDHSYDNDPKSIDPIDDTMLPQQLILISLDPDEKIEIGDIFITDDRFRKDENGGVPIWMLYNCTSITNGWIEGNNDGSIGYNLDWSKKVIATQSQLSPEYIQQFIKEYNNGKVKDVEIEMEAFLGNEEDDNQNLIPVSKPKLTNDGYVIILPNPDKILDTTNDLEEGWEAKLAIKNIPTLPHIINSVSKLRRYYIDGIQIGYNIRKAKELSSRIENQTDFVKELLKDFGHWYRLYTLSFDEDIIINEELIDQYISESKSFLNKKK